MSESVFLDRALCLSVADIAALSGGQSITAMPRVFIEKGWSFALYPYTIGMNSLPLKEYYHRYVLDFIQSFLLKQDCNFPMVSLWAKCEACSMVYEAGQLEKLSGLTVWTSKLLQAELKQRQPVFLASLRVYCLPQPIPVLANSLVPNKLGKFIGLPALDISNKFSLPLKVTGFLPILDEAAFNQRRRQLEAGESLLYGELVDLYSAIASLIPPTPAAQTLCQEVKALIGWSLEGSYGLVDSDLGWIRELVNIGNSSDGYAFEKLVRKSLIKLGFTNSQNNSLDPEATGGAGGLDVYCDAPFSLVGECKASRYENVPNGVAAQLINLGNTHLGRVCFDHAIKVIFSAGRLTSAAQKAAVENQMNIIRPETLQRLVELKAHHPGSINLLELKPCLQKAPFGEEADDKVNQYIDRIWQELKVRSRIIQVVKELSESDPERKQFEVVEIRVHYNATAARVSGNVLDNQTVHELLIELASPFAGYLGRLHGMSLPSDRFYYLRDLVVNL